MKLFAQLVRWRRVAPLVEQVGVTLVVVCVLGLVVASFVPAGRIAEQVAAAPGVPGFDAGGDPSSGATVPGGAVGGDGSAGDQASGGAGTAGASANGGVGSGAAAGGPRTASDQGVTADTIKVGFLVANVGGLDEGGYSLGLRTDVDRVVRAFVDHVNANGGIGGRKVEAVIRKTDPVSQEDQIAACTSMASDNKVFAVINTAATIYAATQRCFTIDSRLPMIHAYALSAAFQASAGGYDITSAPDLDRIAAEWAATAKDVGFLTPASKVGVFTDLCEPSNTVMKTTFRRQVEAAGVASITFAEVDCDPAAQQTQVPNAVLRLKAAGVDRAFLATAYIGAQNFLQNAELQGWRPKYFASPYDGLASNLFTRNFPKEQWGGTQGIVYGTTPATPGGSEPTPAFAKCADIVGRKGLPPMRDDVANQEALGICDHFLQIFVPAAERVGPNLTRQAFVASVQSLGRYDSALYPVASFAPGKVSAADSVALVEWQADCRCFVRTSPHRPARF